MEGYAMKRCRKQYASGAVDMWCDRQAKHAGPCSGNYQPRASRRRREETPRGRFIFDRDMMGQQILRWVS